MYAICHTLHNQKVRIEPEQFTFAGGEVQVTWPVASLRGAHLIQVVAHLDSSDAIMALMLGIDAIRRATFHNPNIELVIPYFPYARQDRVCKDGQSLSVAVIAQMINALQCNRVTICDPHSDVTGAMINNLTIKSQADIARINKKFSRKLCHRDTVIVAPDAGASKKAVAVAKACERGTPVIQALKTRDVQTGDITETVVLGDVTGKRCMLVDDICDGGRTFIQLADELLKRGAAEVNLFVTHGIFSRGLEAFQGRVSNIYTTDSFPHKCSNVDGVELHVQPLNLL
ncbi:MAG: ribose-phosphate pyrophosphokinase [Crocinitomicaceae bacterium]|jgi:ribose-phosphate pyrophosphokinase|nr:ribose-phosphate pyrophosphokinase [Crocinitomicaceae bacterium]|tara:strand:+ start:119858 stop:120715 length:858 start_codon:yes stop_codon:yes gene_type:complete